MTAKTAKKTAPEIVAARKAPSVEQVLAEQERMAEKETATVKANLPAVAPSTAIAPPDNRDSVERYLDDVAPASAPGRTFVYDKDHKYTTTDNGDEVGEDVDLIFLGDQTLIEYIRFNGEGVVPDRVGGLLYDGFNLPPRESLGDLDQAEWKIGLSGLPEDPWKHRLLLVFQRVDNGELFTFVTGSKVGRRACGNLLRHFNREQKTDAGRDTYPLVRLGHGGFEHRDPRVGWVKTPFFRCVGRVARAKTIAADASIENDMSDEIPSFDK
jgi:hypothetical protein